MKCIETPLPGVWLIEFEPIEDERGFFARSWCNDEYEVATGLSSPQWLQCSVSHNKKKGTLRGMHGQKAPFEETKLVRCTRGRMFDVAVDVRPNSPTFGQWTSAELHPDNYRALLIPKGFVHGFQTLEDNTDVLYQMDQRYSPEHGFGYRWNDPTFGITWPLDNPIISEKDQHNPLLTSLTH